MKLFNNYKYKKKKSNRFKKKNKTIIYLNGNSKNFLMKKNIKFSLEEKVFLLSPHNH